MYILVVRTCCMSFSFLKLCNFVFIRTQYFSHKFMRGRPVTTNFWWNIKLIKSQKFVSVTIADWIRVIFVTFIMKFQIMFINRQNLYGTFVGIQTTVLQKLSKSLYHTGYNYIFFYQSLLYICFFWHRGHIHFLIFLAFVVNPFPCNKLIHLVLLMSQYYTLCKAQYFQKANYRDSKHKGDVW